MAFPWCTCLSNSYLTDRCYKLFDSLSKFTEVQSILHCCKRNSDWSTSPCWASKLLQWEGKSVSAAQTRPTHTDSQVCTLHIRARRWHMDSHSHVHLHAQIRGHELTKPHASKHTPEKATVNEPHSRPKRWHQSGTLTPSGSRRTASHICLLEQVLNNSKVRETILCISAYTASRRAKLVGSLPVLPLLLFFSAIVQIVERFVLSEWLFLMMMIYLYMKQLLHRYAQLSTTTTRATGESGACECRPACFPQSFGTFCPTAETERLLLHVRQIMYYTGKKNYHKKIYIYHSSPHHWHWLHTFLLRPSAYLWQSPWGTDAQILHDNQYITL